MMKHITPDQTDLLIYLIKTARDGGTPAAQDIQDALDLVFSIKLSMEYGEAQLPGHEIVWFPVPITILGDE